MIFDENHFPFANSPISPPSSSLSLTPLRPNPQDFIPSAIRDPISPSPPQDSVASAASPSVSDQSIPIPDATTSSPPSPAHISDPPPDVLPISPASHIPSLNPAPPSPTRHPMVT